MIKNELIEKIALHRKWMTNGKDGTKLYLSNEDLTYINLTGTDLRGADLTDADLTGTDLRGADLTGTDLRGADLTDASLTRAKLGGADLKGANLRGVDLSGADLTGVDLDFTQINLSCAGLDFKVDEKILKQLMYHVVNLAQTSGISTTKWFKKQLFEDLETSHLVLQHRLKVLKEREIE